MLKGAVVGLGRMGLTHYAILNPHPDVRFVAACDESKFILKNFKRFTTLSLHRDLGEMLGANEIDFAIIATPTGSHADVVRACCDRRIHMFVEKPFVLDAAEGSQLVERVESAGCVNQVGYFLRFNVMVQEVKKLLAARVLGDVIRYKKEMYGRAVLRPVKSGWRSKKQMGGGCLLDFASHCIDLLHHLFGSVASVAGSRLTSVYSADVEDAVMSNFEHENGVSGNLIVNWSDESYRRPFNRIEIFGTNGRLVMDRQECCLYLRSVPETARSLAGWTLEKGWNVRNLPDLEKGSRFSVRGGEFTEQLDHFVECVREKRRATACTFREALRTDVVIEKIRDDHQKWSGAC